MDTFAQYIGEMDIPKEKRSEYARQMIKLLHAGGMMSAREVRLFDKRICLLSPPELDEHNRAWGNYNYFQRDFNETWDLDARAGSFCSRKIDNNPHHAAIIAAYVLTALYCKSYGIVTIGGNLVRENICIGWINSVLGTAYTNWRSTQLWEIAKLLHRDSYCERRNTDLTCLLSDVSQTCIDSMQMESYMAACHLDELLKNMAAIPVSLQTLCEEKVLPAHVRYDCLQSALSELHQGGGTLEDAKKYLTMAMEERRNFIKEHTGFNLAFAYSFVLPAFAVAVTAREFYTDFWTLWEETEARIPQIQLLPEPQPCPPVEPLSTQDFLRISPDDMAYYWTPDGSIKFSMEMQTWMKCVCDELDSITESILPEVFPKALVRSIAATGEFAFENMFYDFLARQAEQRVQSAVILMQRLAARKEPNIRRYLAILSNPALRRKVFGF